MKAGLKPIVGLILSIFVVWGFSSSPATAGTSYKIRYYKQIKANDSVRAAIKQGVAELNRLHYKNYPGAKPRSLPEKANGRPLISGAEWSCNI